MRGQKNKLLLASRKHHKNIVSLADRDFFIWSRPDDAHHFLAPNAVMTMSDNPADNPDHEADHLGDMPLLQQGGGMSEVKEHKGAMAKDDKNGPAKIAMTPEENTVLTPLMAQYKKLKAAYPDCLLLFRLGDFYELFFDDAVLVAGLLNLTLTRRGKSSGEDIPMCGVPYHAVDNYLAKLIKQGKRIAIAEQVEDGDRPKNNKVSGNNLMARRVVRVVTPGTVVEENLLPPRQHNFLVAINFLDTAPTVSKGQGDNPRAPNEPAGGGRLLALAVADVSTGWLAVETCSLNNLASQLGKLAPAEILVPALLLRVEAVAATLRDFYEKITPEAEAVFHAGRGRQMLEEQFGVRHLSGFGDFGAGELAVLGALLAYLQRTQMESLPKLLPPQKIDQSVFVSIDRASFESLEIIESQRGGRAGSLVALLDKTETAAGGRLLRQRLQQPLKNAAEINQRLARLDFMVGIHGAGDEKITDELQQQLAGMPDLARALARLGVRRGGPRDLLAIRQVLEKIPTIKQTLRQFFHGRDELTIAANDQLLYKPLLYFFQQMPDLSLVYETLKKSLLSDDLPLLARDGQFIRTGFRADLDSLKNGEQEQRRQCALLEQRYRQQTAVDNLKIKKNNIWGLYVEVSARQADRLARQPGFQHRQTLANMVRYNTAELIALDAGLNRASNQVLELELTIFNELVALVLAQHEQLMQLAAVLAELDLCQAMARLARRLGFVRPTIIDPLDKNNQGDRKKLRLVAGRHPVVESALVKRAEHFTANDLQLDASAYFMLLTAPNMAGKSTFLRMVAIIIIMAQAGFYVPAQQAEIAVVDKIFSRVGAADDLARGQSTFMVEMLETAFILQNATDQSLVIMDEIGRGTATFDGLSLAMAITEHLHDVVGARTLFATHYHELAEMQLPAMNCFTMKVEEWEKKLVFFHQLVQGAANHSYGIQVAAMAGVPRAVVERASHLLQELEKKK